MSNCPTNCIETRSTLCLEYQGPDIPELGVKAGDSFNDLLSKITGVMVPTTEPTVTDVGQATSTFTVSGNSNCANKVINTSFNYTVESSASGKIINWNLPTNVGEYSILSTHISIGLERFSNSAGSTIVSLNKLPTLIDFYLLLSTPCGNISLKKSVNISSSTSGTYTGIFEVQDLNNSPRDMNTEEAIQSLINDNQILKNKIESVSSISCESKLSLIEQKLVDMDSVDVLDSIEYSDKGVVKQSSLGSVLTDLFTLIRTVEADTFAVKNHVDSIQIQLNNIQVQ